MAFDRNAWVTCGMVSLVSFFLLNFATVSVDQAVHAGWINGSSVFGVSCGNGHSLVMPELIPTFAVTLTSDPHHEMQGDFIVWGLYGLSAAAVIGVIVATVSALFGSINKVERYAREIVMASSVLIIVAEVVLKLLMWARLFDACLLFRWARLLEHLGMTLAGLVGIPFLYGNTRRGPHPDQQHLMGGIVSGARQAMKNPTFFLAIAMVLGELCGFLTGFYTEEWTWLAVSAVVTILVALLPFAEFYCRSMTNYGELDAAVPDEANEDDEFRFTWTFLTMVLRGTFIWAFIDLPRHVFRLAFERFLDKIEDHDGASFMHIFGDILGIGWCVASILFNMIILTCYRSRVPTVLLRNHGVDMLKLGVACSVAFGSLLAIAILDAREKPTRSWDIGIPMFFHLPGVAVAIEQMLEFLPYLFPRRAFFIGWVYTVLFRYLIRLVITMLIPSATDVWPIWLIVVIALLSSVISPLALLQSVYHGWFHVDDFIAPHHVSMGPGENCPISAGA
ncbi:hypothetical protein AAVH_20342 [Aphelenchoides avenae]|nr:hypothetical protein AAVH_20342 [Aphelenchus avenae]